MLPPFVWLLIPIILVGIVVTIVIFSKKRDTPVQPDIISAVKISVSNPVSTFTGTIQIKEKELLNMTLNTVINIILQKATLPWAIDDIFWNSIKINDKLFLAENGIISQQNVTIFNLVGKAPTDIELNFQRICHSEEKPAENICKGQQAVCSSTGWILVDGLNPPNNDQLQACCKGNSNGPIGTWDNVNNITHCSCGQAPSTDCGDPTGCGSFAQICTENGWECKGGIKCPEASVWKNCLNCGNSGYVICTDGKFSCTNCNPESMPECEFSCHNLQENVCQRDGTFKCTPNAADCPTDITKLLPCCTDPLFPIPVCDKNKGTTTCKDCEDIPKPVNDPNYSKCENGSCDGYGWVCTATGWISVPHIKPPTDLTKCCPITHTASWNPAIGCVECNCSTGSSCITYCGNDEKNFDNCQKTCCTGPQSCFQTINDCVCCEDISRVCVLSDGTSTCCASGYICMGNKCVPICGVKSDGTLRSCSTCLQVDKLSSWQKNSLLTNPDALINTKTGVGDIGYICVENVCGNPTQISVVPKKIPNEDPNFQPFARFNDQFCIPKDLTTTPVTSCNYNDSDTCNADTNCTWRDVVQFMAQDINNDTQLHQEIQAKYNMLDGFYCAEGGPVRKVVTMQLDKNNCGETDCWLKAVNKGTTNLHYNKDTGICSMIVNTVTGSNMNSTNCKGDNCGNIQPIGSISEVTNTVPNCVTRTQDPGNYRVASCPVVNDMCVQYCLPNSIPYGICLPNSVRPEGGVQWGQVMPPKYKCDTTNKTCILSAIGTFGNKPDCDSICV